MKFNVVGVGAACQGVISVMVKETSSGRKIGTTVSLHIYLHSSHMFSVYKHRLSTFQVSLIRTHTHNYSKNTYKRGHVVRD